MDKNELKDLIEERNAKRKPMVKITFEDLTSFSINDHQYKMISDHNNSFDVHQFEMAFNSSFSKFDYIVGQLFDNQLRLRGFYEAGRDNADGPFIGQLNDILVEQLIFSDDIYIIQNLEPRPIPVPRSSSSVDVLEGVGNAIDVIQIIRTAVLKQRLLKYKIMKANVKW
ncbi:YutD-like domain-containing protein [Lentilactobacillus senioris]|uniref:YutD-like domain-containing protein n=1 Tax=Lentilactobacillus senioris TaxID=931534 RepID=UPI0006D290FB|nr:YutD-like domain-containing protein [Lentilactobacillus senioris]